MAMRYHLSTHLLGFLLTVLLPFVSHTILERSVDTHDQTITHLVNISGDILVPLNTLSACQSSVTVTILSVQTSQPLIPPAYR